MDELIREVLNLNLDLERWEYAGRLAGCENGEPFQCLLLNKEVGELPNTDEPDNCVFKTPKPKRKRPQKKNQESLIQNHTSASKKITESCEENSVDNQNDLNPKVSESKRLEEPKSNQSEQPTELPKPKRQKTKKSLELSPISKMGAEDKANLEKTTAATDRAYLKESTASPAVPTEEEDDDDDEIVFVKSTRAGLRRNTLPDNFYLSRENKFDKLTALPPRKPYVIKMETGSATGKNPNKTKEKSPIASETSLNAENSEAFEMSDEEVDVVGENESLSAEISDKSFEGEEVDFSDLQRAEAEAQKDSDSSSEGDRGGSVSPMHQLSPEDKENRSNRLIKSVPAKKKQNPEVLLNYTPSPLLAKNTDTAHSDEPLLHCAECPMTFHDGALLSHHFQLSHSTLKKRRLSLPDMDFKTQPRARKSLNPTLKANIQKNFGCTDCDKTFSTALSLRHHSIEHGVLCWYRCPKCPKIFRLQKDLRSHSSTHENTTVLSCNSCNFTTQHRAQFKVHLSAAKCPPKLHHCTTCGRILNTLNDLKVHEAEHTGRKVYHCAYENCNKTYLSAGDLKVHVIIIHTKEFPHSCDLCGKGFIRPSRLDQHMRIHQKELQAYTKTPNRELPFVETGLKTIEMINVSVD